MVAQRIAREYFAQLLSFFVTLADRIIVAAVLVRLWDIPDFAAWTVAIAIAGITTVFDFGVHLYFGNALMFKVQNEEIGDAQRQLSAGMTMTAIAAVVGGIAATLSLLLSSAQIESVEVTPALVAATLCLIVASVIRMASAVPMALYRAHGQFLRQTNIAMTIEISRIAMTLITVAAGAGYLIVAAGQLAVTAGITAVVMLIDIPRRFPAFRLRYGWLYGDERRTALRTSFGYWLATSPSTLLTYLPVFMLTSINATALAIAQFTLMRTISGFVRTVLQQFSIVLGQEVARRMAIGDTAGVETTYRESALLLTVQTAVAAGMLVALGDQLFALWTGRQDIYDDWLLWLSLAPVVAIPAMTLVQNVFASANLPRSLAVGRLVQIVLTIALFYLVPIANDVLRLIFVIGAAELLGLAVPVMLASARAFPNAGLWFNIALLLRGSLCLVAVAGPMTLVEQMLDVSVMTELMVMLIVGTLCAGVVVLMFGLEASRRTSVLNRIRTVARIG
jgi:O-antigen/teichoic acid export membrane protein